ncbi:hypothetical protein BRC86_09910 [Halobacteriales archaeon QS_3_64_16]|nr:MAG: hypothetical protein BRC86_09910 [Halobacteriales archaeon QS_3_64_16]
MPATSDIRHLTEFEDDDALAHLQDRTPEDRIDFDLLYDAQRVQPWSEGSNEIVRLYFADERLDGCYVPIDFAEALSEDMRSTPLGDPTSNDADEIDWSDVADECRLEDEIDGHEFDLLYYTGVEDEDIVVAAADFGDSQ